MKPFVKWLVIISIAYLAVAAVGTALAVQQNLRADFANILQEKSVWEGFITQNGTALSAPAFMLILQILFTIFVAHRSKYQIIGLAGLMILAVLYTFGQLGESLTWRVLNPLTFEPVKAVLVTFNLVLPVLMIIFGILAWRSRTRS